MVAITGLEGLGDRQAKLRERTRALSAGELSGDFAYSVGEELAAVKVKEFEGRFGCFSFKTGDGVLGYDTSL